MISLLLFTHLSASVCFFPVYLSVCVCMGACMRVCMRACVDCILFVNVSIIKVSLFGIFWVHLIALFTLFQKIIPLSHDYFSRLFFMLCVNKLKRKSCCYYCFPFHIILWFSCSRFTDERWRRIKKNLDDFVGKHPDFWFHCLEAFMVPLRISLPPEADYSPYFLAHGRQVISNWFVCSHFLTAFYTESSSIVNQV